jgi:hypothetical protein
MSTRPATLAGFARSGAGSMRMTPPRWTRGRMLWHVRCATGIRATSINAAPTRSGRSGVAASFGHVGKSVAGTYMPVIVCTSGSP